MVFTAIAQFYLMTHLLTLALPARVCLWGHYYLFLACITPLAHAPHDTLGEAFR